MKTKPSKDDAIIVLPPQPLANDEVTNLSHSSRCSKLQPVPLGVPIGTSKEK